MTTAEITAYVMALPVEELRRLTATEIMGWHEQRFAWVTDYAGLGCSKAEWRPDIDRNQSRMVTDKVARYVTVDEMLDASEAVKMGMFWWLRTPDQETRAALIAHMIHAEEAKK